MTERELLRTGIVVPCLDEAERLDGERCVAYVGSHPGVDLLFADDGSTDGTRDVLRAMERDAPERIGWIGFDRTRGKAEAVRRGIVSLLDRDRYQAVGFWDADLATPLEAAGSFRRVLLERPEVDVVLGARVKLMGRTIVRNPWRHYLGRVFATAASIVLRLPVYDTQCGAKLFRVGDHLEALFGTPFRTRWIFDVEILARYAHHHGHPSGGRMEDGIYELPLTEWRDVGGSKVGPMDYVVAPAELARIWWTYMRKR